MRDVKRLSGDPDEALLLEFLRTGHPLMDVMEVRRDVLDGTAQTRTGSLLTDGVWIWREDLVHYVAKYHLSLPEAFLAHARNLQFVMPHLPEHELVRLTDDAWAAMAL